MTIMTLSSLRSSSKPRSDNDNDKADKEVAMIASASKNNDNHDVFFFAPAGAVIAVADKGGICPRSYLLDMYYVRSHSQ